MPNTIGGLIILVLAILPGLPGDEVYRRLVGVSWREREWRAIVRVVLFSAIGLALYGVAAIPLDLPNPYVLSPDLPEVTSGKAAFQLTRSFLLAYVGHFACAGIAGLLLGFGRLGLGHWTPASAYPAAWDEFTRTCLPERWAVITLRNGHTYAGIVHTVDASVAQSERDIVLKEPALFEEGGYRSIEYQYMFLPAALISSVAAVYDPKKDGVTRIAKPGELLFISTETTPDGQERT